MHVTRYEPRDVTLSPTWSALVALPFVLVVRRLHFGSSFLSSPFLLLMARLSLLTILLVSLFAVTNANSLLSSQQQPIANQDSPVHTTEGWSWEDCGQSLVELQHVYRPHVTLPFLQGSYFDPVRIQSITVSPNPPKPGQDLTVTVHAVTRERIDVRRMYQLLALHNNDSPSLRRVHLRMLQ